MIEYVLDSRCLFATKGYLEGFGQEKGLERRWR